jgi:hypothetical protein
MPISAFPDILTNICDEEPISKDKIDYLVARAKLRLHNFILSRFNIAEDKGLDQATIGRRLGISRAGVSQKIGVPGNWTIESATKLAAAIGGEIDYEWLPFPCSEPESKLGTKNASAPAGQPSQPYQLLNPEVVRPLDAEESDEHPQS